MGAMTRTPVTPSPGPEIWRAWFDGAAAPNPGKIGLGVVLIAPDGTRMEQSLATNRHGCNNEAELLALSLTLDMAEAAGARALEICGDSQAAADWIRGTDTTRIEPLAALVSSIRIRILGFGSVSVSWIPRHKNKEADRLSRQALGLSEAEATTRSKRHKRR